MLLRVPGKGRHPGTCVTATPCIPRLLSSRPATGGAFMSWSVNIGSIAGTAIRIHVTFLLLLAFFFLQGWAAGSINDGVNSVVFVVLVFACVLAHEFGHIFTARAFGVETPDVTLLPIGGGAPGAPLPPKPSHEGLIATSGTP